MKNRLIAAAIFAASLAIITPIVTNAFAQSAQTAPVIKLANGEVLISSGVLSEIHAPTTGTIAIVKLANGKQVLRIFNLKTEAAPDLHVWLHEKANIVAKDEAGLRSGKYLELGKLKGAFKGDSEYELPANIKLEQWKSAVIWCDQFSVAFGVATLNAPADSSVAAPSAESILSTGLFANAEAPTSGSAQLVKKANGLVYVQLKNFKVETAPDLYVWLYEGSSVKKGDSPVVGKGKYLEVAKLTGFSGDFEYALPANTDLKAYKSVVIWCKQFAVAMGAAPLN